MEQMKCTITCTTIATVGASIGSNKKGRWKNSRTWKRHKKGKWGGDGLSSGNPQRLCMPSFPSSQVLMLAGMELVKARRLDDHSGIFDDCVASKAERFSPRNRSQGKGVLRV
jgi:hypothetical protein